MKPGSAGFGPAARGGAVRARSLACRRRVKLCTGRARALRQIKKAARTVPRNDLPAARCASRASYRPASRRGATEHAEHPADQRAGEQVVVEGPAAQAVEVHAAVGVAGELIGVLRRGVAAKWGGSPPAGSMGWPWVSPVESPASRRIGHASRTPRHESSGDRPAPSDPGRPTEIERRSGPRVLRGLRQTRTSPSGISTARPPGRLAARGTGAARKEAGGTRRPGGRGSRRRPVPCPRRRHPQCNCSPRSR